MIVERKWIDMLRCTILLFPLHYRTSNSNIMMRILLFYNYYVKNIAAYIVEVDWMEPTKSRRLQILDLVSMSTPPLSVSLSQVSLSFFVSVFWEDNSNWDCHVMFEFHEWLTVYEVVWRVWFHAPLQGSLSGPHFSSHSPSPLPFRYHLPRPHSRQVSQFQLSTFTAKLNGHRSVISLPYIISNKTTKSNICRKKKKKNIIFLMHSY